MVVHVHRQDLPRFRKRGKRLAETLIDKLQHALTGGSDESSPLLRRLLESIRGFALARPRCFLIPDKWPDVDTALRACLDLDVADERGLLEGLSATNERALGWNKSRHFATQTPRHRVIDLLDSCHLPFDIPNLSNKLRALSPESSLLVSACMEWSTSRFRCSKARIYLAARLLRRWHHEGYDIDTVVLEFLSRPDLVARSNLGALKQLVVELSRSSTFSMSKYLQWLSVRGLPGKGTFQAKPDSSPAKPGSISDSSIPFCSDPTQMLQEISLSNVPDYVISLRNALLERAGFRPEVEEAVVNNCIEYLERALPAKPAEISTSLEHQSATIFLSSAPWAVRSHVSQWIRK